MEENQIYLRLKILGITDFFKFCKRLIIKMEMEESTMKLEQLGDKLDKLGRQLADTESDAVNESVPGAFDEIKTVDRSPAGDGSCRRMDYFAEQSETAEGRGVFSKVDTCTRLDIMAEQPEAAESLSSKVDTCIRLDIMAEQPAAALSRPEEQWLESQPEQDVPFTGTLKPSFPRPPKCVGCAGALMGKQLKCAPSKCISGKDLPGCSSGVTA